MGVVYVSGALGVVAVVGDVVSLPGILAFGVVGNFGEEDDCCFQVCESG